MCWYAFACRPPALPTPPPRTDVSCPPRSRIPAASGVMRTGRIGNASEAPNSKLGQCCFVGRLLASVLSTPPAQERQVKSRNRKQWTWHPSSVLHHQA